MEIWEIMCEKNMEKMIVSFVSMAFTHEFLFTNFQNMGGDTDIDSSSLIKACVTQGLTIIFLKVV